MRIVRLKVAIAILLLLLLLFLFVFGSVVQKKYKNAFYDAHSEFREKKLELLIYILYINYILGILRIKLRIAGY